MNSASDTAGFISTKAIAYYGSNLYCYYKHDWPAVMKRVVSYDGVNPAEEQDFSYSTAWPAAGAYWTSKTTTVTTIDLLRDNLTTKTIYNYLPQGENLQSVLSTDPPQNAPVENTIVYQDGSGNTLRTAQKVWNGPDQLAAECEILPNGLISGKFYKYSPYNLPTSVSYAPGSTITDQVTDLAEYDYGTVATACQQPSTTPMRETKTQYAAFVNTPLWPTGSYMIDRPQIIQVYGYGVLLSETDTSYDGNLIAEVVPAAIGHDEKNYGGSSTLPRGNATAVTRKCFAGSATCGNAVAIVTYDETGLPDSMTDARGNKTQYSFADSFTTDDGSPPGNTNTYLTKITRPPTGSVNHIENFQWDYAKGELRTLKDENGQSTYFSYNDDWNRPTSTVTPDGGSTMVAYDDQGPTPTRTTTRLINTAGTKQVSLLTMDGFGHPIHNQMTSDPAGMVTTDTVYDGLGRVLSISNPYRSTSDPTYGITSFYYDALGRETSQIQPDNRFIAGVCNGPCTPSSNTSELTWTYSGNTVVFKDEDGSEWQRTSDALGRLTKVLEPLGTSPVPSTETDYTYDALNDLLGVTQNSSGGENAHVRSFAYDSLGRLTSANNPETGIVCYGTLSGGNCAGNGYDGNGNLVTKTDAIGNVTTQAFDSLNRLTSQTYSSGDPSKVFLYDQTGANTIGRLTYESSTGAGTLLSAHTISAYDPMGRVAAEASCTIATCGAGSPTKYPYSLTYSYDLAGNVSASSSGVSGKPGLAYVYDAANHLQLVTSTWSSLTAYPGTLFQANSASATAPAYSPFGTLANAQLGIYVGSQTPSILVNRTYNKRARTISETYSTPAGSSLYSTVPVYTPVGDVVALQDSVLGDWQFGYDDLDRLTSATGVSGSFNGIDVATAKQGWTYDSFGNRTQQTQGTIQTPTSWATYNPSNNRIAASSLAPGGAAYDGDGRLTNDGSKSYLWEAQGWLCGVTTTAGDHYQYIYDAQGRLATTASRADANCYLGTTTLSDFIVDQSGEQVTEVDGSGAWKHTNVFANGELLATYDATGLHYALNDWLGDKRVQATPSAPGALTVDLTCWNLPFNDGYGCSGSGTDATELHYTGKEHDPYTGLDLFGAREYANYSGRFLSPDWSKTPEGVPYADLMNPQSLNLYSYVKNNPLSNVDKDGHCAEDACVVEGTVSAGIVLYGAAVGAAAYFNTPSGQRSLDTFTSAAGTAISGAFHGITSLFSSSSSSAPAAAPAGQQVPATAPGFVGDAGGNVVQIPAGSVPRPADNGNGVVYQPPVAPGQHPDADAVRVMGPDAKQPTGSITVHGPTGQPINPATGKPDTRANTHTPIVPSPPPPPPQKPQTP